MPTIPTQDAATLRAWEIAGIVPPGTLDSLRPGKRRSRRPEVVQTEIGPQTRRQTAKKQPSHCSEREFQRTVIDYANLNGWRVIHHPDSRRATGAGWVDLVLGHEAQGRVVFAELKTERGRVRADQAWWHAVLTAAGCEVHVWRPSRWGEVVAVLGG